MLASLLFYAWGSPADLVLLLCLSSFVWAVSLLMSLPSRSDRQRRFLCMIAVAGLLAVLGLFKYSTFILQQLGLAFGFMPPQLNWLLPPGLSFYTFRLLSYILDLYNKRINPQYRWTAFILYTAFFPQVTAGPIMRYDEFNRQLTHRDMSQASIIAGISRFLVGLSKKVLLADRLSPLVNRIMGAESFASLSRGEAIWGLLGFTMQIYLDFSGYSDMAIGLGRMFGFSTPENFNYPYVARSVTDFWRRWHISLSSFFRDYVYIPLGGNRRHQLLNLLLVWSLTGLWHGAGWNFILWGLYYFTFLMLEKKLWKHKIEAAPRWVSTLYTVSIASGGWLFFYFSNFRQAGQYLYHLFAFSVPLINDPGLTTILNNLVLYILSALVCLPLLPRLDVWLKTKGVALPRLTLPASAAGTRQLAVQLRSSRVWALVLIAWHLLLVLLCTAASAGSSYQPFLYFKF
ncbi:MAG: MBOAT family protein [Oscillospiraceae bacterium]|nr:MBOAT family protein [Oscillospiraceae bacterium]MDD4368111.1 MBOAT family protein [Oscillospiraceae bacterium]